MRRIAACFLFVPCFLFVAFALLGREYTLREVERVQLKENLPLLSSLADFDGNGTPDFIVGRSIFFGGGDGTFAPETISQEPLRIQAVGDVDGDGYADILNVAGLYWDTLEVRLNRDRGSSFSPLRSYPLYVLDAPPPNTTVVAGGISTALADVNRDGFADVVAAGRYRSSEDVAEELILVGFGPDPGPIESFRVFPAADPVREGGSLGKLEMADLNGDGFPDLVSAIPSDTPTGWVTVFLNDRAGGFSPPHSYPTIEKREPRVTAAAIADVDRDGDLDLVAGHWHDSAFAVLLNRGDGSFETLPPIYLTSLADPTFGFTPRSIRPGDVDRDGRVDLLIQGRCSVESYVGLLDPATEARRRQLLGDDFCFEYVEQLHLADFNGDQVLDVVANGVSTNGSEVRVFQGLLRGDLFVRGDANDDGAVDISDPIAVIGALFLGSDQLPCLDAADANDDGLLDISDPIHALGFLFLGPMDFLPDPHPACGPDPITDPSLGCERYTSCAK